VHPYKDEQYLNEHPDTREKVHTSDSSALKPPAEQESRRHSYSGPSNSSLDAPQLASSSSSSKSHKKGFLSKLKDKAIGTKEEREAERQNLAIVSVYLALSRS